MPKAQKYKEQQPGYNHKNGGHNAHDKDRKAKNCMRRSSCRVKYVGRGISSSLHPHRNREPDVINRHLALTSPSLPKLDGLSLSTNLNGSSMRDSRPRGESVRRLLNFLCHSLKHCTIPLFLMSIQSISGKHRYKQNSRGGSRRFESCTDHHSRPGLDAHDLICWWGRQSRLRFCSFYERLPSGLLWHQDTATTPPSIRSYLARISNVSRTFPLSRRRTCIFQPVHLRRERIPVQHKLDKMIVREILVLGRDLQERAQRRQGKQRLRPTPGR